MLLEIFQNINIFGNCNLNQGYAMFSFNSIPAILLYSYIPAVFIALALSLFILKNNKKERISAVFFIFAFFYSLWVLNTVLEWVLVSNQFIFFAWQIEAFIEVGFYISTFYLLMLFVSKDKIAKSTHILNFVFLTLIIFLIPTVLNVKDFDYESCQGFVGNLWYLIYGFEIFVSVVVLFYGFNKAKKIEDVKKQREVRLFTFALASFIGIFTLSNIFKDVFNIYSFDIFGPLGMLFFMGLVAYLIVEYKTFNVKLISAQVLVWGLAILVGAQFVFARAITNYLIVGITFLGIILFGQRLIRSVKKEVKQKEELAILNANLENLIQQRESLVHLVTHKVKGSFTRSKFIFDGMLSEMFGQMTPEMRKMAKLGFESNNNGVKNVDLILNAANLEKGRVKYDMKSIDLKDIVIEALDERKERAEKKKLDLEFDAIEKEYNVKGDAFWLKEAIDNLIENSIRYTKVGSVQVSLKKVANKILFTVKDTGVGISVEDKKNLFTEGGRGKDSTKINVDSTGYGLYTVKLVIEAHGGRVWVESDGPGKGSTFYVEMGAI